MQNSTRNQSDPFEIEKRRDFYATNFKFKKFKSTYSNKFKQIPNKNSSILWDNLNFSRKELVNSPIYKDKIVQVLRILHGMNGRLLNVGIGNGAIEDKLSGFELYGIDISRKSIKNIKKKHKGIFKVSNILSIPFETSYFDYILCLDVLEHISPKDTFKALNELSRVLKVKGVIVISVPLNEGLEQMVKKGLNPNAHVRVYTSAILKAEVKLSGFEVEREIYLSAFQKQYFLKKSMNNIIHVKQPNLLIITLVKR